VGGAVGENNFKFFIQFTGYTALYCIHVLVVMALYVAKQKRTQVRQLFYLHKAPHIVLKLHLDPRYLTVNEIG